MCWLMLFLAHSNIHLTSTLSQVAHVTSPLEIQSRQRWEKDAQSARVDGGSEHPWSQSQSRAFV